MTEKKPNIKFDPSDFDSMLELMDKYGDSDTMHFGENDNHEKITISIFKDKIVVVTFQNNGWVCKHAYYRDGDMEETFDGKWR